MTRIVMRPTGRLGLSAASLLVLLAQPAAGQMAATVNFRAAFANAYVDRGVILSQVPVIQPQLSLGFDVKGGVVALDIAGTLETTAGDSTTFAMAGIGGAAPTPVELSPALRLEQPFLDNAMRIAVQARYRRFLGDSTGIPVGASVFAPGARISFPKAPLKPSLLGQYEVGGIRGAYAEARVGETARLTPGIDWTVGAAVGWAFNQRAEATPQRLETFAWNGVTHVEVTTSLALGITGVSVEPMVSLIYQRTPLLDAANPLAGRAPREWFLRVGGSIGLGGKFPKPKPPPPPKKRR